MRVNVTGQPYDYMRPWQKKAPFSKRALGAVLPKNRVLVTADLVANQNYVELERAESGEKTGADVVVVDYEANLALIEPNDKKFLDGLTPLQLALDTVVGDRVAALQLEATGALVVTEGIVTTVQMMRYPADVGQFLTYRISMSMQYRDNSYTIPLVKNNKLAGLLLRYDPRSQVLDAIPAPIIAHFLKEAETQPYRGFPAAGFTFFPTRDPQLRKFAGQTGKPGGVYVTSLEPNMPAAKAGLQVGDIVVAIGNNEIDQNGNYVDPLYGKIEFTNLITSRAFVGDTLPVQIQRQGKPMQLNLALEHRNAQRLCDSAVCAGSAAALLRAWRDHFPGALAPIPEGMGRQLAEGSAPAFCVSGPVPVGAFPGRKSASGGHDAGPASEQHDWLRRSRIS